MPIIRKDNLFQKLDFDFSVYVRELLPENQIELFSDIKDIHQKVDKYSQKKQYGTTTYFFFFLLESINVFFMQLLKQAENLSRWLQQVESQLKKNMNPLQKKFLEGMMKQKRSEFILYKILLEDITFNKDFNQLYDKLMSHYLECDKELVVPQHYFLNYVQYQVFMANIIKNYYKVYGKQSFQIYLKLLQKFLSEKFKDANQNVKAEFMDLLFTLNIMEKGKVTNDILVYIKDDKELSSFVNQILGFYSNIDFLTDHDQSGRNKFRYRYFCSKFLHKALEHERYAKAFKENQNTEQAVDFLGNLLTDLNYFVENVFQGFPKIKELEEQAMQSQFSQMNLQNQQQNQEEDEEETPEQQLQSKKEEVKQYLKFGKTYLKLFEQVSLISPDFLNNDEWAQKVVLVLNYYAERMSSQSYVKYKFSGIKELGFQPLEFIKIIVSIYYRISDCQLLKEEIVKDERSYSKDILIDIGTTAMKKKLVSIDKLQKFEEMIKELEILKEEKEQYNKLLADYPDDFTCQISYELMRDPVRLPSSHTIVDYQSIKKHLLLSGQYDPFNREKLTIDMVEMLPELKKKIENWKEEKLREFKKNSKQKDIKLGQNINQEIEYQDEQTKKESNQYNLGSKFQLQNQFIDIIFIQQKNAQNT